MALNVNIIGRDSEGNLRALKVNSEGNLDFGQLETEIQAVKANQLSGDQKVQLSGTNTVLLSGFYDRNEHWTFWQRYYWGKEGTMGGNNNVPLDVRSYREIAVRITSDLKRQGVEQTIKYAVYAYTDLISRQDSSHAVDILVPLTELAYGATIYLTADKYPKLADPHLGILVHTTRTIFQSNDEGGTTVEIIGRV